MTLAPFPTSDGEGRVVMETFTNLVELNFCIDFSRGFTWTS